MTRQGLQIGLPVVVHVYGLSESGVGGCGGSRQVARGAEAVDGYRDATSEAREVGTGETRDETARSTPKDVANAGRQALFRPGYHPIGKHFRLVDSCPDVLAHPNEFTCSPMLPGFC